MSYQNKCCNCGYTNSGDRFFCKSCGSFLKAEEFSDPKLYREEEWKIKRITENLSNVPHDDILWNATANKYVKQLEKIKALLCLCDTPETYYPIINQVNMLIKKCKYPEYQIAFVGTIKTGKSTLINALLGKNYASTAVTPETAALTKFRKSYKDYVNITFYSSKEWDELWSSMTNGADTFLNEYKELNAEYYKEKWIGHDALHIELSNDDIISELTKWSSSKSPEHYFVKEIEVGISTLPKNFPTNVVFVDTPGLSDPVVYRSEITKKYIKRANAVFVCVEAQKIHREEIQTIDTVFSVSSRKTNKVFIVATHWDTMNDPYNDWEEQKVFMKKQLVGDAFYRTPDEAEKNIFYSAAYIYNICRAYPECTKGEKNALIAFACKMDYNIGSIDQAILEIMKITNIEEILDTINDELVSKYSSYLIGDISKQYNDIINQVKRYAQNQKEDIAQIIDAAKGDKQQIETQLKQSQKNLNEINNAKVQLVKALQMVKSRTDKQLKDIISVLEK